MNSRLIQLIAAGVLLVSCGLGGALLPGLDRQTEAAGLRYTDVSVEGAPPIVAIGTAIGALRGLIVNYLWIKVNLMKEQGLFYEVMADSELITKLQPRFAAVWAFHGHNMAYNISVATHTQEERWEWVNAGIRLVRNEGLRHNPNDLVLHRELAFWFAHKIEGYSDDAHLFYKRAFCAEWHFLLGAPPDDVAERVAWMKAIADAPRTLEDAERRVPGVLALIARFDDAVTPFDESAAFAPTVDFLRSYGMWEAVRQDSQAAAIRGTEAALRAQSRYFVALDELASDPELAAQWAILLQYTRRFVLENEYNMDPHLMYEYMRDLGPIDWRHGQAHALYWSRRGSQLGEGRLASDDNIYKILNNDRTQLQAMQELARFGRIQFDPFSTEPPTRFPEPRWIDTIEAMFYVFYEKHYGTRGAGGETFIAFLRNFMASAIRQCYRSGEHGRAQELLDGLREKFGPGTITNDVILALDLAGYVKEVTQGEYEMQPHVAPSEAFAGLTYAFREGVGRDRREVYEDAVKFVDDVVTYFKINEYNNYVTKWGEGRMKDIIGQLETMRPAVFAELMADPSIGMNEKVTLWANVDKYDPLIRAQVYDIVSKRLGEQFASHELSTRYAFGDLFPAPPNLEAFRTALRRRQLEEEDRRRAAQERDTFERK